MAVTTPSTPRVATRAGVRPARRRGPRSGTALVLALLAACAYAVFADGAIGLPEEPRLQIGLAVIALLAAVGWLFSGTIDVRAPGRAWLGVALLAAFAAWAGLTLVWSVAPDRTWAELNRALAYTLVVVLGIAAGTSAPRAIERVAIGWLVVAVTCALYAVGGKVIPGIDVLGLDFNHAAIASRLRAPLEYWNALALVCVLAVPVAMRLCTDIERRPTVRLAGLSALFVLITCVGMTYSRGGLLALAIVVGVVTALGGARLRGLAAVGAALTATIPVLALAFARPPLTDNGVALGDRIPDGAILGVVMLGSLVGLLLAGWWLLDLEQRTPWSEERSAAVWRRLRKTAIVLGVLWFLGAAGGEGGLGGTIDRAWEGFSETSQDKVSDPARIVSSNSGNRWVWWQEAAGAFSDRPLRGWGAGSFPVTHKQYREVELGVSQPHNVPLQFLAETGLIGALLALGGVGLLLAVALARVRGMAAGRERDVAVALFAGAAAWAAHGLYDWDWDIPGVTVPALLFLGVLAASARGPQEPGPAALSMPASDGAGARGLALAAVCLLLGLVMISAILPAWADSKATSALTVSTNAGAEELEDAAADAELASRLDPTAIRSLLAASSIAQGRGRLLDAKRHLLDAVDRQPYSATAWQRLLELAFRTADRRGAEAAARRLLELDPIGAGARTLAARLALFTTPAGSSPTATGTPLAPAALPAGQIAPGTAPAPGIAPPAGTPPGTVAPGTAQPQGQSVTPPGADVRVPGSTPPGARRGGSGSGRSTSPNASPQPRSPDGSAGEQPLSD